ncbi:hypothetical protein [Actinoallomurus sp. CA-150999]|uniref:hypothetical protein n=1 Tax=Actinoallomurus sp. CA-150999 TaxID=3239887 RepID=UPI003D945F6C
MPQSRPGVGSVLPVANRVARIGGFTAVLVGLSICVIVQQAAMGPATRHPVRGPAALKRTAQPAVRSARRGSVTALERGVRAVVLRQRGTMVRKAFGVQRLSPPEVSLTRVDGTRGWAFGGSVITPPAGVTALPETSLFIAVRARGRWEVCLAGTPDFTRLVREAPATVVRTDERPFLERFGDAKASGHDATADLSLPWRTGQSWTLQPVAGNGGLRFSGGDGRVLAPAPGRLYRLCSKAPDRALLLLVHSTGLASVYYQVTHTATVPDGTLVRRGTYLGMTGTDQPCGGAPAGGPAVVRFALLNAGRTLPVDGARLGGWAVHATSSQVWADRAGLRIDAGNPLLNFGTGAATASPVPLPSTPPG